MKPGAAFDFETLVELYYRPVFTFAVRLCGKLERALELTQHTFCLALNHDDCLGKPQRAKNWLFTLLFREFLREERLRREPASSFAAPECEHLGNPVSAVPILAALDKVPKDLRAPLVLFYAKDLSFSQIADCLGLSMDAVLTLLAKGSEEMRLALAVPLEKGHRPRASFPGRGCPPAMVRMAA